MLVRGGKGDGCVVGFEEGTERMGGFVVNMKMCNGVIMGVKEMDDVGEGGAARGRGAGGLWFKMDVAIACGDEKVFMSQTGWHRIATGQVIR